jgi:hypothetical protein
MVGATRALRSQFRLGVLLVVEVLYSRMISVRPLGLFEGEEVVDLEI